MYLFSLFFAHLTKARVLITLSIDIFGKDVNFWTTLISSMQVYHPTFWMIVQSSSFCFPNSAGKKLNKNKNTCKIYFASSWHLNRKRHDFIIWYEVLDPHVLVNIQQNGGYELRYKEFTSKNGTNCLLTAFNWIS